MFQRITLALFQIILFLGMFQPVVFADSKPQGAVLDGLFAVAERHFEKDDFATAELAFKKIVDLDPLASQSLRRLIEILQDKQPAEALTYAKQLVKINPKNGEDHYRLALVYDKLNNTKNCILELETALRLNSRQAKAVTLLAHEYWISGNRKKAVNFLQKESAANPTNLRIWRSLCCAGLDSQNLVLADEGFSKCLAIMASSPSLAENALNAQFADFRYLGLRMLQLDPSRLQSYLKLLELCSVSQQPLASAQILNLMSRKFSNNPEVFVRAAQIIEVHAPCEELLEKEWQITKQHCQWLKQQARKLTPDLKLDVKRK